MFIILSLIIFFAGYTSLSAADIKGKVTLSPKGEPYAHGNMLLMPLGEEMYTKAEIDEEGSYQYTDLTPGRYLLKRCGGAAILGRWLGLVCLYQHLVGQAG